MKTIRTFAAVAALTAGTFLIAGPAAAQSHKQPEIPIAPPVPTKSDQSPPVVWNYLVLVVIIGAAFAANMIPSKRGHQD